MFSRPGAATFFIQVAPQLTSRGWVDPVPDPRLLRKSGSAGDRTRNLCICSQKLWPLDHRGGHTDKNHKHTKYYVLFRRNTSSYVLLTVVCTTVYAQFSYLEHNIWRKCPSILMLQFLASRLTWFWCLSFHTKLFCYLLLVQLGQLSRQITRSAFWTLRNLHNTVHCKRRSWKT